MLGLTEALIRQGRAQESETLIVAYTHGPPAQPTTCGITWAVIEVLERILGACKLAHGGLSIARWARPQSPPRAFPIDRAAFADLLGLRGPLVNSLRCIGKVGLRDGASIPRIKLIFVRIWAASSKTCSFWSAFEVGQLYVPNASCKIQLHHARKSATRCRLKHMAAPLSGHLWALRHIAEHQCHNTPFTDMN